VLILERAVFLHVPKTGGTWVRRALEHAGVDFHNFLVDNDIHADLSYCPCPERFKFGFVRHPFGVYGSYWRFKMNAGWDPENPFDQDCRNDSFEGFVAGVLDQYPGWCGQMFEDYVGPPHAEIEFIERFEHLADDLVKALRLAGEVFDERRLREVPPVNSTSWPAGRKGWSPALFERVARAEQPCLSRFGYSQEMWNPR
jgi:hypothetical protein